MNGNSHVVIRNRTSFPPDVSSGILHKYSTSSVESIVKETGISLCAKGH